MSNLVKIAEEYYRHIDAKDYAWVVDMFAEDSVYDRAGALYKGKSEIAAFYMEERKIDVRHKDIKVWDCGRDIFVEGTFQGKGADGSTRAGGFSDHWTFNESGKVILRRTSLFTGSSYIRK